MSTLLTVGIIGLGSLAVHYAINRLGKNSPNGIAMLGKTPANIGLTLGGLGVAVVGLLFGAPTLALIAAVAGLGGALNVAQKSGVIVPPTFLSGGDPIMLDAEYDEYDEYANAA